MRKMLLAEIARTTITAMYCPMPRVSPIVLNAVYIGTSRSVVGDHQRSQHDQEQDLAPAEAEPRERVAGEAAQYDVRYRDDARDQDAVQEQHEDRWRQVLRDVAIGIERQRVRDERQADRIRQRLERRYDRPSERDEHQQGIGD